jgi:hypothetical protein
MNTRRGVGGAASIAASIASGPSVVTTAESGGVVGSFDSVQPIAKTTMNARMTTDAADRASLHGNR